MGIVNDNVWNRAVDHAKRSAVDIIAVKSHLGFGKSAVSKLPLPETARSRFRIEHLGAVVEGGFNCGAASFLRAWALGV